ncbi:Serine/threonine-protein phosphatase 6 regulatory subunit at N-terminal half [Coccomyxa sp. Obi]|nr:Serine/threonine-protein phosphatase 6 regulatory subunit at N-terminal half [Coccomyxa sp. Obi]
MFWRVPGYSQPSPLEAILDMDGFTLEDLLDEADLIQECKSLNGRLVNFLKEPSTVQSLLSYLVDMPEPGKDEKQHFKYAFTSCEVLCCEVDQIYSTLLDDEALLTKLFSFLDCPKPLNLTKAGYFARVVLCLLVKRSSEMLSYLEAHPATIQRLVDHIDTTSIAEVLCSTVGADERTNASMSAPQLAWLADTRLMPELLERLGHDSGTDALRNAASVLVAIARAPLAAPLARSFLASEFLQKLLESAFVPTVSVQVLDVLIALLKPRQGNERLNGQESAHQSEASEQLDLSIKQAAVQGMVKQLPRLVGLLEGGATGGSGEQQAQETPFGQLSPPLGSARLKAVEVIYALLALGDTAAEVGIMESGVAIRCLDLFTQFPFNNLLHHRVAGLIVTALERGSDKLLQHLIGPGQLIHWLTSAPEAVTPQPRASDANAGQRGTLRAGYIGHVTALGNKLGELSAQREAIAAALAGSPEWSIWLQKTLQPRNERENVHRWACGRPSQQDLVQRGNSGEESMLEDLDGLPGDIAGRAVQPHRYAGFENGDDDSDDDDDLGRAFDSGDDFLQKDGVAKFRTLRLLGDNEADDSSSSSDDDENITSLHIPQDLILKGHMQDEDMVVMDMEDDAVVVEDPSAQMEYEFDALMRTAEGEPGERFEPFTEGKRQMQWQTFPEPSAFAKASGGPEWSAFEDQRPAAAAPDSGWADFDERPAFSGAADPALQQEGSGAAARPIQPPTAPVAAADSGPGEPRSHSPPIDIPASSGGVQAPQFEGEDPALSQYSSFQYWRSPPTMLADDVELGDLREDLGEGLSPPAPIKAHVD